MKSVILGHQADGTFGLRCAPSGYDASTNPVDQTALSFSSDWTTMAPLYHSGVLLSIGNGATSTFSYTSLGYIPIANFMYRNTGTTNWWSLPVPYAGGSLYLFVGAATDHIKVINRTGATIDVAYAIFKVTT